LVAELDDALRQTWRYQTGIVGLDLVIDVIGVPVEGGMAAIGRSYT